MKNFVLFLAFFCMAFAGWPQARNYLDQPYLETSARVDTLVTPDQIYLEIRLQESDTKGRTSLEELEQQMGNRLKNLGVDLEKQLTVSQLSSDFRKYFLRKQDILKEKTYQLLLYDAPSAGQVLYELERIGISNVRLHKTEYADMDGLQEALKARAVIKSRRQARIMTEAIGQALGRAIFISDSGFSVRNTMKEIAPTLSIAADEGESAYLALPSDFDKIQAETSVRVVFLLE